MELIRGAGGDCCGCHVAGQCKLHPFYDCTFDHRRDRAILPATGIGNKIRIMDEKACASHWAEGRAMTMEQAIQLALNE